GNAVANFVSQTVSDDAAPQIQSSESRYTMDNNDNGTIDFIRLHFTESVADASVAATDFKTYITTDAAGSLIEAYTSGVPTAGGNRTDAANDEVIFIGVTSGTETISANKTNYALYIQTVGSIEDASANASSAEGSAVQTLDSAQPRIVSSRTEDLDTDGQIDTLVVTFTEDLAGASVTTDDFAVTGFTVSGVSESAGVVTVTMTESGSADTQATPALSLSLGVVQDASTLALVSDALSSTPSDSAGPVLLSSEPANSNLNVSRNNDVTLTFSEPVTTASFTYTCCGTGTDPGGWSTAWSVGDTVVALARQQFQSSQNITIEVTAAPDGASNIFAGAVSAAANPFTFTTQSAGGIVVGVNDTTLPTSGTTHNQTIKLVSPNGGGTYDAGSTLSIAWTQQGRIDLVNVSYSTDGGSTWTALSNGMRNTGAYAWTLPQIASNAVRVKVEGTDLATIFASDSSDGSFTIAL
ncbi:MAG: Ig-like domain-containing protein, partial [Patescibacteria group bacterium]